MSLVQESFLNTVPLLYSDRYRAIFTRRRRPIRNWNRSIFRASVVFFVWILLFGTILLAADQPNFSGTYTLKHSKSEFMSSKNQSRQTGPDEIIILRVIQDTEKLEITRSEAGRETSSLFSMKSGQGIYMVPGGASGNGKIQFKAKRLLLESEVILQPLQSGPRVPFVITERWELSPDSKTLTIQNEMVLKGGGIPGITSVYTYSRN
jgi:hypothetical protein